MLREGIPVEVPVEKGDTDGQMTQILKGEIAEGDLVIVDMTEGK